MALFNSSRPKGITEGELKYVREGLLDIVTKQQTEVMLAMFAGYMDADSSAHKEWRQANADEVDQFLRNVSREHAIHLTDAQQARVKALFEKYVATDRSSIL